METNVLEAEEVLAAGEGAGEGEAPAGGLVVPLHAGGGDAGDTALPDAEPVGAGAVPGLDVVVGGTTQPGREGTGMVGGAVGDEANVGTGGDVDDVGGLAVVVCAQVAADVVAQDVLDGAAGVDVVVLADTGPLRLRSAVDGELGEAV